jgi:hypothetical protein
MIRVSLVNEHGVNQTYLKVPEVAWLIELLALLVIVAAVVLPVLP